MNSLPQKAGKFTRLVTQSFRDMKDGRDFLEEKKPQKDIRKIKIKDGETAEKLKSKLKEHRKKWKRKINPLQRRKS